jgi:arylsulfatase A-like enzyme
MKDLGTRVPLIVNWQGTTRGSVCSNLVDITDFYATLAEIAGVSPDAANAIDGVSFLSPARG